MTEQDVREATRHLRDWIAESNLVLNGRVTRPGIKAALAASSLQLSQEHAQAVRLLLEAGVQASAFALLRPQLDALTRGIWLSNCASDEWCQQYSLKGNEGAFNTKTMFRQIGAVDTYKNGAFEALCERVRDLLHDFTHGGYLQIHARLVEPGGVAYLKRHQAAFACAVIVRHLDFVAKKETANLIGDADLERELDRLAAPHMKFDLEFGIPRK